MRYTECKGEGVQLDDVWVAQSAHILDLSLHPRPRLGRIDDLLRDELHRDLVSSYGVYCHYASNVSTVHEGRPASTHS